MMSSGKWATETMMDLGDIVLSWSIENILDQDLYTDQLCKIPHTFASLGQYLEAYVAPLIEETRSELCGSLEMISEAPYSNVLTIEEAVPSKREGSTSRPLYYIDVDFENTGKGAGGQAYRVRNGDFLILSCMKPEAVEDLSRSGVTYCLALVTDVAVDDEFQKGFKAQVSKPIDLVNDICNYNFCIFLTNILTQIRISRALSLTGDINMNFNLIKTVLSPNHHDGAICGSCLSVQNDVQLTRLREVLLATNLNQSQTDAVQAAISSVKCKHLSSVKLIWGPPGTGKTKTVSVVLWVFLSMKYRTLICAPTNVAVVGVCLRLLQLMKQLPYGDNLNGMPSSFGDVVLFGNRDRMDINDELGDVFLDNRVDQLADCFAPFSGWKHRLSTMINFLEECISEYDLFVEIKTDEVCMGLLEFVKKQFNAIALPLESCLRKLWLHSPSSSVTKENTREVFALLEMLDTFASMLSNGNFTEEELKCIFSHEYSTVEYFTNSSSINSDFLSPSGKALANGRMECLCKLRILHRTLNLPYAVEKNWIRNYCLQKAKLIFCTASSSSHLHYMEMVPLDVLVIDEAAQLKECESAIPLRLNWIRHAILVGDERQLPSLVKSQVSMEAGFGLSLFERLGSLGYHKHLLNVQYRMHPSISFFPNFMFYGNQLLDGPNVKDSNYGRNYPDFKFGTYAFIHIADGKEEADDYGNSRKNMVEVAVVLQLVRSLFKSVDGSGQKLSIGVLSPYSAQVHQVDEMLRNKFDMSNGFNVRVRSIDGFQGQEDDVIILSTVRSNNNGNVGFLENLNRTNVSLTRARHCLWILGNGNTLARSGTVWEDLVHDAVNRKCFFNATDEKDLAKVILHAKHELSQLDDLLNSNSALFSNSLWKILFSDDFVKSFTKLRSPQFKKEIIQMLKLLSEGWRSKRKNCFSDSFDLTRTYRIRELYLIWTIDIESHERHVQVIKVWDLSSAAEITRLLKRLENFFSTYTDDLIHYCRKQCIKGKLVVPMIWEIGHDIIRYKKLCRVESTERMLSEQEDDLNAMENCKVSESFLLMKFYSLSSGVAKHLLTASDGTELNIPYELTTEEEEVVRFPRSTFILGRSGTGKTTVLTMKLIQREQQCCIASRGIYYADEASPKDSVNSDLADIISNEKEMLRQVFVTVSPKLCSAISSHINRLKSFVSGDCSTAANSVDLIDINDNTTDFLDIPDCFHDLPAKHFPLVITFWKFLLMLDGTTGNSFFAKYYIESGLLVERGLSKSHALQVFIRSKEVNYERFVGSYWPHFNIQLTKNLDASTVFTQIISHIKGGLQADTVFVGKLGRNDYIMLSEKRISNLSRETREMIYDIFVDYERKKSKKGEFDLSDFVMDLHCRLVRDGYMGDMVDFVYIDEVQDLTMRQITLFKYVCKNFQEGFTFAGDTAQTIARGIDFRFEDIRSLFYTEFLSQLPRENPKKKQDRDSQISDKFQLTQNFRTHVGVLKLAQSIIDLLYNFFPLNVDKLNPETSHIYGEAPVILECGMDENAILNIFGSSATSSYTVKGFGSEQVILVRDDCSKQQILDLVGKQALVLTILECKGLEFQDVLLYNFFGESPLKNLWRVVYQYMENQGTIGPSVTRSFPSFDGAKHNILCSELKQLYVAITRTRQRLWICESCDEYSRPMFDYWMSLCLVQVKKLDSSLAQEMRAASSPEDWKIRGIKLFNEGNFEMASMCFERAGDEHREMWAKAAGLCATADRIIFTNREKAEVALKKAATIYESIGKFESAANCYIKLKEFKKAGIIYQEKCGTSKLEAAGDCFSMAKCWSRAALVYSEAKCFSTCLNICSERELFDDGLQFIEKWNKDPTLEDQRHQELAMTYLETCAGHYFNHGDFKHMMKFVKAFPCIDLIRSFLKQRNRLDDLLRVESEMGNYIEAAAIAKFKGDLLLEAKMHEKAHHFVEATKLILLHVVTSSLWSAGSNGWPLRRSSLNEKHLMKAKQLAEQVGDAESFYRTVCSEVYILSSSKKDLMNLSEHLAVACKSQNVRLEVFTLLTLLDLHLSSEHTKYQVLPELVSDVDSLESYTNKLLSESKLSSETLIHIWNMLKDRLLKVLACINSFGTPDVNDLVYEEFCLEYFGVRRVENRDRYLVLYSEACWIKDCSLSLMNDKNWINRQECMLCAQQYWSTELLSLGMAVLEKLQKLRYSTCRIIHSIFEVTMFLESPHYMDTFFSFLKSRNLLNELCLVEAQMGNYIEAVAIAKFIGDLLLEAEMLEKANHFQEASKLILFHVVISSLWASGSKGWPLRRTLENKELLLKSKELAEQESHRGYFYSSVCSEVYILSDRTKYLTDMPEHLAVAVKTQNVRLEILTLRTILDLHLNSEPSNYLWLSEFDKDAETLTSELLSQNNMSTETLIHLWNLLKAKILKVLAYSYSFEKTDEEDLIFDEFFHEYFGVRKLDDDKYIVMISDASWIKNRKVSLSSNKNWITRHEFMLCAQQHWSMELLSLGVTVLEKLESLHWFSLSNRVFPFSSGWIILYIYEVSKFLEASEFVPRSGGKIYKFSTLCQRCLHDIVFPLDWRNGISQEMKAFHENGTARELLKYCLRENMNLRNAMLTHGGIGRIVGFVFLTGELDDELYERIIVFLNHMPSWKGFVELLKEFLDSGIVSLRLVCEFQEALRSTFFTNWAFESDYISPQCYINLLECLMFLAMSCQGFRGYSFSTRSSLFQMLKCKVPKGFISGFFTTSNPEFQGPIDAVFHFIINMIQSLMSDKRSIQRWIAKSSLPTWYYQLFVLKLTILLFIGYLNTGCDIRTQILPDGIFEHLPKSISVKLSRALSSGKLDWAQWLKILADSLKDVGDPLVVICSHENYSKFSYLDACVFISEEMKNREIALTKLLQRNPVCSHTETFQAAQEKSVNRMSTGTISSIVVSYKGTDSGNNLSSHTAVDQQVQRINDDEITTQRKTICHKVENMRCLSNSEIKDIQQKDMHIDSGGLAVDLDLKIANHTLHAGIKWLENQKIGGNRVGELESMLDGLKMLSVSEKESVDISIDQDLSTKWQRWDPWLQSLVASSSSEDNTATEKLLRCLPEEIAPEAAVGGSSETPSKGKGKKGKGKGKKR